MDRTKYIEGILAQPQFRDNTLAYAFARCLSTSEQVELLKATYCTNIPLRNIALYVLCESAREKWGAEAEDFVVTCIEEFRDLPANRRASACYCLGRLFPYSSTAIKSRILTFLFKVPYIPARRKAIRLIANEGKLRRFKDIRRCAFEFGEHEAIMLLVKHAPVEFLLQERKSLVRLIGSHWLLGKLYLRLCQELEPQLVEEIKETDGLSYAYVKAKIGQAISAEVCRRLVRQFRHDERFGVLIWALGKMGHWKVLEYVAENLRDWELERFRTD